MSVNPQDQDRSYSVERAGPGGRCKVLRGRMPASVFLSVAESMPRGSVISSAAAQALGAMAVFGLPDDIEALMKEAHTQAS